MPNELGQIAATARTIGRRPNMPSLVGVSRLGSTQSAQLPERQRTRTFGVVSRVDFVTLALAALSKKCDISVAFRSMEGTFGHNYTTETPTDRLRDLPACLGIIATCCHHHIAYHGPSGWGNTKRCVLLDRLDPRTTNGHGMVTTCYSRV